MVYSILLLHSFPVHEYVTIYLSILLLMGIWIVSGFPNSAVMNVVVYICGRTCVRAFLGQIPPVEFLVSCIGCVQLDNAEVFTEGTVPVFIPMISGCELPLFCNLYTFILTNL